jgi:hypothetical protein
MSVLLEMAAVWLVLSSLVSATASATPQLYALVRTVDPNGHMQIGAINTTGNFSSMFKVPIDELCPMQSGKQMSVSSGVAYVGLFRDFNSASRTPVLAEINLTSGVYKSHDLPFIYPYASVIFDKKTHSVILAGHSVTEKQDIVVGRFDLDKMTFVEYDNLQSEVGTCTLTTITTIDFDTRILYLNMNCPTGGDHIGQLQLDTGKFMLSAINQSPDKRVMPASWGFHPADGVVGVGTLEVATYPFVAFKVGVGSSVNASLVLEGQFRSPCPRRGICLLQSVSAFGCSSNRSNLSCTYLQAAILEHGIGLVRLQGAVAGGWSTPSIIQLDDTAASGLFDLAFSV